MAYKKVRYKGKVYLYPRDYKLEYSQRTDAQKKNGTTRKAARRKMVTKLGKAAVKGKDVHHMSGMSNKSSNLRVLSKKANRSKK